MHRFLDTNQDARRLRRSLGQLLLRWNPAEAATPHAVYCNRAAAISSAFGVLFCMG